MGRWVGGWQRQTYRNKKGKSNKRLLIWTTHSHRTGHLTLQLHLFLTCGCKWGTTGDFSTSFLHFLCSPLPLGFGELQACPLPDVTFPLLFLSVLSSSSHYTGIFSWAAKSIISWETSRTLILSLISWALSYKKPLCSRLRLWTWSFVRSKGRKPCSPSQLTARGGKLLSRTRHSSQDLRII